MTECQNGCERPACERAATVSSVLASTPVLDIRTYRCTPGTRDAFVQLMAEEAVPMLKRAGISVVTFGPSIVDNDGAFLIRSFTSVAERDEQLSRFYSSDEWRDRYDERVMAMIETYMVVVAQATGSHPSAIEMRTFCDSPSASAAPSEFR
jgi:hypothetical protein